MRIPRSLIPLLTILAVSGCDFFEGPSAKIPSDELRKKWRECKYITSPSRTKALACDNYNRECDRRKNKGDFVCY